MIILIIPENNKITLFCYGRFFMNALIISCGNNQGLRPITCSENELMIKIMGKPVLGYMIEMLLKGGLNEITVASSFRCEDIEEYLDDCHIQSADVKCLENECDKSVSEIIKSFAERQTESFVLMLSPCITDIDISKVLLYHKSINAQATVICSVVEETDRFNIVNLNKNGTVVSLFEKPDWSHTSSSLANTEIYVLEPEISEIISSENRTFNKSISSTLLQNDIRFYGYQTEKYWNAISEVSDIRKTVKDLLLHKAEINLPSSKNGIFHSGKIPSGDYIVIPPVYFGNNVKIGFNCTVGPYSVIEDNVKIEDGVRIKKSIVHKNAQICTNCDITGAIIGRNCILKRNSAYLEGCCIGDGCIIESSSTIHNNVSVWPKKNISYRSVLTSDLKDGRNEYDLICSDSISGNTFTEITPERCSSLASALASSSCGGKVAVGYGTSKESKTLAMSVLSGLISCGSVVYDFGETFESQMHFYVSYSNTDSGVFIDADKNDTKIKLFGRYGLPLSCKEDREIENRYKHSDFRRAHGDNLNSIYDMSSVADIYNGYLLTLSGHSVYGMSLSVCNTNCLIEEIAQKCFDLLGIKSSKLPEFSIDNNGRNVTAKDENGRFVATEKLITAVSVDFFCQGRDVCVPFEAPPDLEKTAKKYNRRVLRTGESSAEYFSEEFGITAKQCMWAYDGLSLVFSVIGIMNRNKISLSELVDNLPECNIYSKIISCSMPHSRIAEILDIRIDRDTQGVRKTVENGFLTILRQGGGRHLRIVAQADTIEAAREICIDAERKINIDTIDNMSQ